LVLALCRIFNWAALKLEAEASKPGPVNFASAQTVTMSEAQRDQAGGCEFPLAHRMA
jgi:hypothetical protein